MCRRLRVREEVGSFEPKFFDYVLERAADLAMYKNIAVLGFGNRKARVGVGVRWTASGVLPFTCLLDFVESLKDAFNRG